ncbi:hypothetical protein APM58_05650 [Salmonella enterica subsp. enterica serovar Heidelberg]|nr:hypothetical protein [Salmonella enterica subsp. enterica serovar Heidelberg]ECS2972231.1 hypothetical protein [Salmonella enterica subsp. enterica serovar Heidelberg]ECV1717853.1 hypothetical protein [Salmonella enterica subsp. enterica serovar Heidelberg]
MMSLWDALRMNMMISYQELVRTFLSRTDWLMIETLAQGASLKEIARQQSVPYHRVVYRLKQLITLLNLPHRQSFLRLVQQLNVTFHDIF